jgi:hypothetical protein
MVMAISIDGQSVETPRIYIGGRETITTQTYSNVSVLTAIWGANTMAGLVRMKSPD